VPLLIIDLSIGVNLSVGGLYGLPAVLVASGSDGDFRRREDKRIARRLYHKRRVAFPIKVCAVCSEEFELKPDKPGFANRCPSCSEPEKTDAAAKRGVDADERKSLKEANEARRSAIRDLLYRKDS
jgi:hypothetical protein